MTLPPPDYGIMPELPTMGQTIVEVIAYPPEKSRFIITVDATGLYRVFEDGWNTSWVGDGGSAFWFRQGPIHFTDTLLRARAALGHNF